MWVLGGLLGTAATAVPTWILAKLGTQNLPASLGPPALVALVALAGAAGFLMGAAIARRATRSRSELGLFSAIAGSFSGAVIGCAYALTLTAAYLGSYSTWPEDRLNQILVLLSYPVFGGLGLCIGAAIGMLLGLIAGGVVRVASIAR